MAKLRNEVSLKMDFQNLMSCIECHKEENNVEVIIETLRTIVSICSEEKFGKDAFRDVGGLDFLLEFLIHTEQLTILEYSLNVLAFVIEGNIHSQTHLTEEKVFQILQTIFEKKTYPLKVLKNAVVLFSTILFQNRSAQDLINKGESLLSLMNLYKYYDPIINNCSASKDPDQLEIWLDINRSLCFAVNNPLNEKNQLLCSDLFPIALKIIEAFPSPIIIEASSSLLSLSIANNEKNQDLFAEHDGFLILKRSLNKTFEQIQSYMKECNNIISKGTVQIVSSLISVISGSVLDHEKNASLCGKLGIVSLMIELLYTDVLDVPVVKKTILALGHCIGAYNENRFIILDVSHFDNLLKKYLKTNDPELHSAARYLLQACLHELDIDHRKDNWSYFSGGNLMRPISSSQQNSDQSEQSNECITRSFSNGVINSSDSLYKLLKLPQCDTTSFQKRSNLNHNEFRFEQEESDGQNSDVDSLHLKDNLGHSSESDISLQSAGHFYRLQKMKIKGFHENERKSCVEEFKFVNVSDKCPTINKECRLSAHPMKYFDTKSTEKVLDTLKINTFEENWKNQEFSDFMKPNTSKQKATFIETKNKNTNCSWRSKSGRSDISKFSLKQNKKNDLLQAHLQNTELPCNTNLREPDKRNVENPTPHERRERKTLEPVSTDIVSNKSTVVCEENSKLNTHFFPDKKLTSTPRRFTVAKKPSDELGSFKLKSFREPPTAKSKSSCRRNAPGCLEVIVLPGAICCEHKLATQIELLKVCPIENGQHST